MCYYVLYYSISGDIIYFVKDSTQKCCNFVSVKEEICMKMKRLSAWLLVFAICLGLTACSKDETKESTFETENETQTVISSEVTSENAAAVTDNNEEAATDDEETTEKTDISQSDTVSPLLYRVTDDDGDVIWLFGSIHVGREDYYPLPDYVLDAYENADSLAVEADVVAFEKDVGLQIKALTPLVYRDGTTIEDHIPEELYESAVEILEEYGMYNSALDMYCPFFWSSMIDSLMMEEIGARGDLGIDKYLLDTAYEENKDVIEIESVEIQYKMMADFDEDVQLMILESSVEGYESFDESAAQLEEMMDIWASGNEKEFAEYLSNEGEEMTDEEKEVYARYEQIMITDRNLAMASFAEDALKNGEEVFICVGSAHVVGEGAMAELLAERGYKVECITK